MNMASEWASANPDWDTDTPLTKEQKADIRYAVHYCHVLHELGHGLTWDPPPGKNMEKMNWIPKDAAAPGEKNKGTGTADQDTPRFQTWFEVMKGAAIAPVLNSLVQVKNGTNNATSWENWGTSLQINILMAMYQDVKIGLDDNAEAGFELMIEPPSRDRPLAVKTGENMVDSDSRVIRQYSALQQDWAELYQSWNMAFVSSNFKAGPWYMATLLAPVVSDSTKDPGMYLYKRVIVLALHIRANQVHRSMAQTREDVRVEFTDDGGMWKQSYWKYGAWKTFHDWRSDAGSVMWGKVNKEAGDMYRERVQKASAAAGAVDTVGLREAVSKGIWDLIVRPLTVDSPELTNDELAAVEAMVKVYQHVFPTGDGIELSMDTLEVVADVAGDLAAVLNSSPPPPPLANDHQNDFHDEMIKNMLGGTV